MEHFLNQSSKHIPMSETILETIRTLNAQAKKYSTTQNELSFSYSLDAKNLATSYLSQLGTNSELPISTSIDDESFIISVKKELVLALSQITSIYNASNEMHKSIEIIEQGIPLAKECSMDFHHAQFCLNLGSCYFRLSQFVKALHFFEECLRQIQFYSTIESGILKIKALNNIGNFYYKLKDYSTSLYYYRQCVEVKNMFNIADTLFTTTFMNLGMVYAAIYKFDESLENYKKAKQIAIDTNDFINLGLIYNNLGNYWTYLKEFDKAMECFQDSIQIKKANQQDFSLDTSYYNIAIALTNQGRYNESVNFIEEGLIIAKKNHNYHTLIDLYLAYADLNIDINNSQFSLEMAIECLDNIDKLPQEMINEEIKGIIYGIKSTIAERKGNFQEALQFFKEQMKIERDFETKQFEIHEKLLKEQLEYERKKFDEISTNDGVIQIEALRKEHSNLSNLLERTKENVTTLLEQKNDLIRMASHDLKNPLNNILGFAEYLLKEIPTISYDEIKEYATYIRDSAHRMTTIITTILDVNKSGTSSINVSLQKTDVATIVQTLLKEYSQYAQTKNISISQNIQAQKTICETDADLLKQIIDNIFSNAIKYSPLGSNVRINVRSQDNIVTTNDQQTVESVIIVEIEDKGPGFTEDDRINMFGTYAKLSAKPTAGEHSTGLGLSIVKKLSELIHVSVWCESTVGEGSTFFIEIPEFYKR